MIAVYLKGQCVLYTEAKTLCEQRLNKLMLPAIFNTALCAVISLILQNYTFGATIVSCLTAINTFLLSLISYLKLDARAEAHRNSAYKFDKIQAHTVFSSGRTLFGVMDDKKVIEFIEEVEKEVNEIKDSNHFVLPEYVRVLYPTLYNTNVFAEVKKIMYKNIVAMEELKIRLNNKYKIEYDLSQDPNNSELIKLYEQKHNDYNTQVKVCIEMRKEYQVLDEKINKDLISIQSNLNRKFDLCRWLKN
jgi:hypothetical protein